MHVPPFRTMATLVAATLVAGVCAPASPAQRAVTEQQRGRVVTEGPTDPRLIRGEESLRRGHWRMAAGAFQQVLDDDASSAGARSGLGRALEGQGRCDEALPLLLTSRGTTAWSPLVANAEARCRMRVGELDRAVQVFEESLALDPGRIRTRTDYGRLLLLRGDVDGARRALEPHPPRGSAASPLLAAEIALETDQGFEQARQELDTFAARNPAPWLPVLSGVLRGRRSLDRGAPHAAAEELRLAIPRGIANVEAAAWHAEALRRTGDAAAALRAISRPLITVQQHPLLRAVEARILADLGRLDEAAATLGDAPAGRAAAEAVETLASRWYLARARHDEQTAHWAARWRAVNPHPRRSLDDLVPRREPDEPDR